MEGVTGPAAAKAIELLNLNAPGRVLDVGTGTGVAARAAASAFGPGTVIAGADPSLPMVARARTEGGGPAYVAATSIDLPFRDETFDAVLLCFVIAHFHDHRTALFDVMRVLKTGGRLAVATWATGEDADAFKEAWREVVAEFAEDDILADAQKQVVPWEERFSDPDTLKDALHEAGLRDIWVERMEYRVETTREDYLTGRETSAMGRFLRDMLGEEFWPSFQRRVREVFAERFPERFNDFHQTLVAVGHKG
jgi:ubiquinone/menaquinone biosynthesis C-methylase UbiE